MVALVKYFGGKVRLAPKIAPYLPLREVYVEPFGGAAAVLLHRPRSRLEVYNDLDGSVVELFRVIREHPEKLARLLSWTPYARAEFDAAYASSPAALERVRRLLVRSRQGFGSKGFHGRTGFATSRKAETVQARQWLKAPAAVREVARRFRGVQIESRPALELLDRHDGPETTFYLDPPYLAETRVAKKTYAHEMTAEAHDELLQRVRGLRGAVAISGYRSDLYDHALSDWKRVDFPDRSMALSKRTDCLWLNAECMKGL